MAQEVLDVISRLTFEANTAPIDKVIGTIEKEIAAIDQNTASIQRLEAVRASTDKANLARIKQIDQAIDNRKKKIQEETAVIATQIKENEKLQKALAIQGIEMAKASDRLDVVKNRTNSANVALINLGRVIQDSPFGFIGIANNLNPLIESFQKVKEEAPDVKGAFDEVKEALKGPIGLGLAVSVVSALLTVFGDKLFSLGDDAADASKGISEFTKSLEETAKIASQEIVNLQKLSDTITNTNLSYKERGDAVDELQRQYPAYFGNIDREKILNGEVGDSYKLLTANIINRAKATAQYNLLAIKQQELTEAQLKLEAITNNRDPNKFFYDGQAQAEDLRSLIRLKEHEVYVINKSIQSTTALGANNAYWLDIEKKKQYEANQAREKKLALMTEEERKSYLSTSKEGNSSEENAKAIRASFGLPDDPELDKIVADIKELEMLKKAAEDLLNDDLSSMSAENLIGGGGGETAASRQLRAQLEIQKDVREQEDKDEAEALKKRKKNIETTKVIYASLRDAVMTVLNDINQRQIQQLDNEIQVRERRVDQAKELAERGNTEVLRLEQERLEEAEKLRREAAQKQIIINNALALSNAIVAVATTAAETGVGAIAAIPAVIAALVAGYAFVRSLDTETGFKKGGYTGDGNPNEAAGPVHRKEFVFNEGLTAKYRPLFEAIHKTGDIPLAYTATMQPAGGFASKKELKTLGDRIVGAIEDNHVSMSQRMDRDGVAQSVESVIRKQKRLWG